MISDLKCIEIRCGALRPTLTADSLHIKFIDNHQNCERPMHSASTICLVVLLALLPLGCEKVPTFQELTSGGSQPGEPAVAQPIAPIPAVEKTAPATALPDSQQEEKKVEDTAKIIANLSKLPGSLTDQQLLHAASFPAVIQELTTLDASNSKLTDEGIRLLGRFSELTQVSLIGLSINGSGFNDLKSLANLRRLIASRIKIDASTGWEHLGHLSQLELLDLTGANITDAQVASLKPLTGLKEINVSLTQLTDRGLSQLAELENLEVLRIEGTHQINGTGFQAFTRKKPKPELRCIYANLTRFSPEGLRLLKQIPSLELFDNTNSGMNDQSFFELKGATNLKTLVLTSNNLTSASGNTLRTMRNLEHLNLSVNGGVNDQIFNALMALPNLKSVKLGGTGCTLKSVEQFRRLKKNCDVVFNDSPPK